MCDSLISSRDHTKSGYMIYGKNSDRGCNEPQFFTFIPAADHAPGSKIRCTYIEVDQVAHTNAVLLSKLSWTWGGEMGLNDKGVIIGNEAVFSRECSATPALLGMDLVRLVLERASTAREGVHIMGQLLERYGQGGNGHFSREFYYDNGFFIVDPYEAWYFETAGSYWAAKQVHGNYAIGNYMSMAKPDIMRHDAISHAIEAGYPVTEPFDFAATYMDWERPNNACGMMRRTSCQRLLEATGKSVTREDAWRILCSHTTNDPFVHGHNSVCKHAVNKTYDVSATASMIAVMDPDDITLWGSTMSTPCMTLMQPMWLDTYNSRLVYAYEDQQAGVDRWVRYEGINRAAVDGRIDMEAYTKERDELQARIFKMTDECPKEDRQALCDQIADMADAFVEKWLAYAAKQPSNPLGGEELQELWRVKNEALGKDRRLVF